MKNDSLIVLEWWGRRRMVCWDSRPPRAVRARIEYIDHFCARGMRRVYGRGDHFPGRAAFNMDIWRDRHGKLYARFWSRSAEFEDMSLMIHGIPVRCVPEPIKGSSLVDDWVPKAVRDEYDEWVFGEF